MALGSRSTTEDVLAHRDLTDLTIVVTGCNAGIGFETARALAAHGAHVWLACRSEEKAAQTAMRIRAAHPEARLSPVAIDLASFASIRAAETQITSPRIDVLICNAGLYAGSYGETLDGIECTVGVCHFGHFLLTSLLMDRLRSAAPARVVMVSSESHRHPAVLRLDRLPTDANTFKPLLAYGQAKLCNVLFANELTRRYREEGVLANSLHPGSMIGTSIFRDSLAAKLAALAIRPFTKSIAQGAATSVYCAVSPDLEGVGGRYFADCRPKRMSEGAEDEEVARRLWEISEARVTRNGLGSTLSPAHS